MCKGILAMREFSRDFSIYPIIQHSNKAGEPGFDSLVKYYNLRTVFIYVYCRFIYMSYMHTFIQSMDSHSYDAINIIHKFDG